MTSNKMRPDINYELMEDILTYCPTFATFLNIIRKSDVRISTISKSALSLCRDKYPENYEELALLMMQMSIKEAPEAVEQNDKFIKSDDDEIDKSVKKDEEAVEQNDKFIKSDDDEIDKSVKKDEEAVEQNDKKCQIKLRSYDKYKEHLEQDEPLHVSSITFYPPNESKKILLCKEGIEASALKHYIKQYKEDPDMIQMGPDVESDDEYKVITARSGNTWRMLRVKRN
jgi:hypothetical protein